MRANVDFGAAGETIFQQGFDQKISEPRHAGPTICVRVTMRSELEAISPFVGQLMALIKAADCVAGAGSEVEVALRDALANVVLHGNKRDTRKKVHVCCRIRPGKELSLEIRDDGTGFDLAKIPDPAAVDDFNSKNGRGIRSMQLLIDAVSFEHGGCEVRLQKGSNSRPVGLATNNESTSQWCK